jgi:hypothetical protein
MKMARTTPTIMTVIPMKMPTTNPETLLVSDAPDVFELRSPPDLMPSNCARICCMS